MSVFKNHVGRPSNKTIKKRRIITCVLAFLVFAFSFGLTFMLFNINTKNIKGESKPVYYNISCEEGTGCYDSGFRDGNFYQKVVEGYNAYLMKKNDDDVSYVNYTYQLDNEDLSHVTFVFASYGEISNLKGIEKLTGLRELDLRNNKISTIDLSNNTNLQSLKLDNNMITELDLSHNLLLTDVRLDNNKINNLNLTPENEEDSYDYLIYLSVNFNNLSGIYLDRCYNLEELSLNNNVISELSLTNLTQLKRLKASDNALTEIHLNGLSELDSISLGNNYLTSIDLSENPNIYSIRINNNKLSEIDLSNLTDLRNLILSGNNIETINFENNPKLGKALDLDMNLYKYVDFEVIKSNYDEGSLEVGNSMFVMPGEKVNITEFLSILSEYDYTIENTNEEYVSFENGIITGIKTGYSQIIFHFDEFEVCISVMVSDELQSDKYEIDNLNRIIHVNGDSYDDIVNNILIDRKLFTIAYDEEEIKRLNYEYKINGEYLDLFIWIYDDVAMSTRFKLEGLPEDSITNKVISNKINYIEVKKDDNNEEEITTTSSDSDNPGTFDDGFEYFILFSLSIISLSISIVISKKRS